MGYARPEVIMPGSGSAERESGSRFQMAEMGPRSDCPVLGTGKLCSSIRNPLQPVMAAGDPITSTTAQWGPEAVGPVKK
ncbi:hypothetical protein CHELA17_40323 [Chelatococcus asaccharovorans]|nr:hypothetical protein CHELA17_40323 [Chelatococcus asaccharovorans]